MSFVKAVACAGSLEALLVTVHERRAFARASFVSGLSTVEADRDIPWHWWTAAHDIDPAAGRAAFTMTLGIEGANYERVAIGIEFVFVEAPTTTASAPPHAGGRDPDNDWEGAAGHVDALVRAHGPLPRKKDGTPNVARAVALMAKWFEDNEPPPVPRRESIYRWLRQNPHPEWWL
jgi:hypothetical protein